jgi:hypothetical protein
MSKHYDHEINQISTIVNWELFKFLIFYLNFVNIHANILLFASTFNRKGRA